MALRKLIAAAVAVLLITSAAGAADVKDFEAREQRDAEGNALPYRLFRPKDYDPAKKYPLVLFLHGAGERGTNNTAQVRDALYFAKASVQAEHPCFVMAPQCPANRPAFQVYGSNSGEYDPTYAKEYGKATAGEWKAYRLQLGKLPTGVKTHLLIDSRSTPRMARPVPNSPDNPRPPAKSVVEFKNVRVYESGAAGAEGKWDLSKMGFPKSGAVAVSADGSTITVTGDARLKVRLPQPYMVTKDTMMEFEFRSPVQGAMHAIGLDTDEQMDYRWVQVDWGGKTHAMPKEPSTPMRLAMAALDKVRAEFSIDPSRIYLTGLSMGGYGTWDLLARRPGMFAAAVPVCGGADETTAPLIRDLPIWCFHGGADKVVPTQRSRNMIEALKKAGGTPKYTEYPGVGHNSWDKAYSDAEMIGWMFGQRK